MADKTETIFVIWDFEDATARAALQALERRPPSGMHIVLPNPRRWVGVLEGVLLPGIQTADRVLIVFSSFAEAILESTLFATGLAIGYGKPTGALCLAKFSETLKFRLTQASRSFFEPWGIDLFRDHLAMAGLADLHSTLQRGIRWSQPPAEPAHLEPADTVVLCPSFGEGVVLRKELAALREDWLSLDLTSDPSVLEVGPAGKLIWVLNPLPPLDLKARMESAAAALLAGLLYSKGRLVLVSRQLELQVFRAQGAPRIPFLQSFERTFSDLRTFDALIRNDEEPEWEAEAPLPFEAPLSFETPLPFEAFVVEKLTIHNFKGIEHLEIDFTKASSLPGHWTCVAGINGSGKSAILQALAMLLLGERLVAELGGERIRRMPRRSEGNRLLAELSAVIRYGREQGTVYLSLSEEGVDRGDSRHAAHASMRDIWQRLEGQVVVSYGASRNLSDFKDSRYVNLSRQVQRQMTLFDPLTQIASVEVLLDGGSKSGPILRTLQALLGRVLSGDLAASEAPSKDRLVFSQSGTNVEAIDLPDGFRSSVAWLADLCAAWHQTAPPEETETCDPARITGIVLIDEIDLHLHPSLQRALIPRLREALPKVQFIVTTHSPLVLSSFDRAEIVVLDRASEGGIRTLDRQIFAFSTDQVYDWLMDTPPQSTVLNEKLKEGTDPDLPLYLYQSKDKSEEQAKEELEEIRRLREKLLDPTSKQ